MANQLNLNDPSLYQARPSPTVHKAQQAELGAESPFLFDDDTSWDEPLESVPFEQTRSAGGKQNPYAKKREEPKPRKASRQREGRRRSGAGGHPILYASIISICAVLILVLGVLMMPQVAGFFWKDLDNFAFINGELLRYDSRVVASYKQYRDYLQQDVIYPGVFVDGTHVGGMSVADAQALLAQEGDAKANSFSVAVNIGNKSWTFDNSNVAATRNLGNVLERAHAIGRRNTTATLGTALTPFRERVSDVLALRENGVNLRTESTYDHDAVRALVAEIAAYVTRDAVDSQLAGFDFNTRTFTFSDEQPGVTIDANALYAQVIAKLDAGANGESITVEPVITTPKITKAEMMSQFKLIAAYTTSTTKDSNRNTNIDLACQAINGAALMPGETFSFNKATGQRTTDKGYKSAGAIAAGQSIEEVGGGICQVSSTLFNAVARADLEITSRSPHAWPSSYVNKGEDATVNWPNLDFKFTNNKSTPIFVITYYKDRKCSAEIWGMTLGDGVTIDLSSTVTRTIEPSTEVNYVNNTSLPTGTSKETVKARTGYVVETYKVWYKDGAETKRELLHTSTYKAYQRTVEWN